MVTAQAPPAGNEALHPFEAMVKSPTIPPVSMICVIERLEPPVFESVTIAGALVVISTCGVGKLSGLGEGVAVGGARPVPLRLMVCVPLEAGGAGAVLLICSVALRGPVAVGVKVTMIVHCPPPAAAPGAPHPEAWKSEVGGVKLSDAIKGE